MPLRSDVPDFIRTLGLSAATAVMPSGPSPPHEISNGNFSQT